MNKYEQFVLSYTNMVEDEVIRAIKNKVSDIDMSLVPSSKYAQDIVNLVLKETHQSKESVLQSFRFKILSTANNVFVQYVTMTKNQYSQYMRESPFPTLDPIQTSNYTAAEIPLDSSIVLSSDTYQNIDLNNTRLQNLEQTFRKLEKSNSF